jgi:hypothetical protein
MKLSMSKPIILALEPTEQATILRGLGELPAKDSLDLINRIAMLIANNEQPPVPEIAAPAPAPADTDAPVKQMPQAD